MRQFDAKLVFTSLAPLAPYLRITLLVTVVSATAALLLGAAVAAAKLSGNRALRAAANGYTTILRCTPSIVMLFLVYYGIPKFSLEVLHKDIDEVNRGVFVVISLSLLFSASMSEAIRSAFEAVPKGQHEAAACAGLNKLQAYRRIILPQMWYIALPNLGNTVITLLKEGANAFTIGFIDLIGKANLIVSNNLGAHSREIYLSAALIYWITVFILERLVRKGERILGKGRKERQHDI